MVNRYLVNFMSLYASAFSYLLYIGRCKIQDWKMTYKIAGQEKRQDAVKSRQGTTAFRPVLSFLMSCNFCVIFQS